MRHQYWTSGDPYALMYSKTGITTIFARPIQERIVPCGSMHKDVRVEKVVVFSQVYYDSIYSIIAFRIFVSNKNSSKMTKFVILLPQSVEKAPSFLRLKSQQE